MTEQCKRCGCVDARGGYCAYCADYLARQEAERELGHGGICCNVCGCPLMRVYYTRRRTDRVVRRRICANCGATAMTVERIG